MVRLSWCDAPGLPAEVAVRDVPASARFLRTPDGEPWAQVVSSGDFAAVRLTWDGENVLLNGCATIDAYLMNQPDVPPTAGIVRRIRLVEHLCDKGETGWVRRPGSTRLTDVTSTGSAESPPPPPDGKLVFLSAEQHFALAGDTLPDQQWQPDGHVIELEVRPLVRIVHLNAPAFAALADGDLVAATMAAPVPPSAWLAGPDNRSTWRRRARQTAADPAAAAWVTGIIWDERRGLAVGRAGFHGPPDAAGLVEIGYAVDPAYRRRGYARAALESLLRRASAEPAVSTVRLTITPDNTASNALAADYGFVRTGEQVDDEDGLEIIFEIPARGCVS